MPAATYCLNGGVIGGTATYRPVEPWERGWGHPDAPILCSNLICRCCSTSVRSVANHTLRRPPGEPSANPMVRAIDFAGRRIDLVKGLRLEVDETARTFACACRAVTARAAYPVAHPLDSTGLAIPWACKGHPPAASTNTLDGEPLPADAGGWLGICQRALSGEWPTHHRGRDVHDARHPAFRLAHLMVHLNDVKMQAALGRRIASWGFSHEVPAVRYAAVDFFRLLPRFPGFDLLGDALSRHRALYDDVYLHGEHEPSLGTVLRATIATQLASGPAEPLSSAVRMDLLAGFGSGAFARIVVRDTPTWAIERMLGLVAHDPVRRATLREAMQTYHPGLVTALDRELAAF